MKKSLVELEAEGQLRLPHSPWGGSFSGMDIYHTGDMSQLTFTGAGRSTDERMVAMTASMQGGGQPRAALSEIDDAIDIDKLMDAMNKHIGISVQELFNEPLGL